MIKLRIFFNNIIDIFMAFQMTFGFIGSIIKNSESKIAVR